MEMLQKLKKVDPMKMKAAAGGVLFVKLFGLAKSLMFLAGVAAGYLLAMKMDKCKDEEE